MKTLITILFSCFTLGSFACGPHYYKFDGYVYMSDGAISKTQLKEFQFIAYEDNGNTPAEFQAMSLQISLKPVNSSTWLHIQPNNSWGFYYSNKKTNTVSNVAHFLDSFVQTLSIGDSIRFWTRFRADSKIEGRDLPEGSWFQYRRSNALYEIQDEATVDFTRNSDRYIKTYPNPAINEFTLDITIAKDSKADYFIMDQFGRKVKEARLQSIQGRNSIYVEDLAQGQYFFYLTIDGNTYIRKFVKVDEGV
ncbi:T9SS type A sorting domain-containing protein [bacterium]|nr:T9SS type A sorting domain-containing protein [bacterium]